MMDEIHTIDGHLNGIGLRKYSLSCNFMSATCTCARLRVVLQSSWWCNCIDPFFLATTGNPRLRPRCLTTCEYACALAGGIVRCSMFLQVECIVSSNLVMMYVHIPRWCAGGEYSCASTVHLCHLRIRLTHDTQVV